jgi:hypothetical protein
MGRSKGQTKSFKDAKKRLETKIFFTLQIAGNKEKMKSLKEGRNEKTIWQWSGTKFGTIVKFTWIDQTQSRL